MKTERRKERDTLSHKYTNSLLLIPCSALLIPSHSISSHPIPFNLLSSLLSISSSTHSGGVDRSHVKRRRGRRVLPRALLHAAHRVRHRRIGEARYLYLKECNTLKVAV